MQTSYPTLRETLLFPLNKDCPSASHQYIIYVTNLVCRSMGEFLLNYQLSISGYVSMQVLSKYYWHMEYNTMCELLQTLCSNLRLSHCKD
jgi:hypothetical protein